MNDVKATTIALLQKGTEACYGVKSICPDHLMQRFCYLEGTGPISGTPALTGNYRDRPCV